MIVNAEIINVPKEVKHRWIVARREDSSAELWWYASYDDEELAYSEAQKVGNGIVLERSERSEMG